jgi:hypothetical protein
MPSIQREHQLAFVPSGCVKMIAGERAGPYVAAAEGREDWTLVYWDGKLWHDPDGFPVIPLFLLWLPSLAEFLADQIPAVP